MIDNKFRNCIYLSIELAAKGYRLSVDNGVLTSSDDVAVQAIIDSFDPVPPSQLEATDRVNEAAGLVRAKYATDIPFQSESYKAKLADCKAFQDSGTEATISNYMYVNARATRQGVTGAVAAKQITDVAAQWDFLLFNIEDLRDAANEAIQAETDWTLCSSIADEAILTLEGI